MENNKLDIKEFLLKSNISDNDRILMTDASNAHYAAAMTIRTFREQILKPLFGNATNNLQLITLQSIEQYNSIARKDERTMYVILGGGKIRQVYIGQHLFATGVGTLGEMDNVVEEIDEPNDSSEMLVLMQRPGESEWTKGVMTSGSGSSGGSTGASIRVTSLMTENSLISIPGREVVIGFNFVSEYFDDQTETGPGTGRITVNGTVVSTQSVQQGDNYINVTEWLTSGTNTINIRVTNSLGSYRALTYTVNVMNLSISSTFDDTQIFTSGFQYKFTPLGMVQKTVHFELDDVEIGSLDTAASNTQLSFNVPVQSHGSHTFRVFMTTLINGQPVRSNELFYDLVFIASGNKQPVIASSFNRKEAFQHEILSIPFMVYTPESNTSSVSLYANDVLISTLTVDKGAQMWNHRLDNAGELKLRIQTGNVRKEFSVDVAASIVQVEAVKEGLELYLTSSGRSNRNDDRNEWKWDDISSDLNNFNFSTNGWIADPDGSVALKVSGDARVDIPFKIFGTDLNKTGKTIEFEFATTDVSDYQADIIRCMDAENKIGLRITAQEAIFGSEMVKVEAKFKEDERIRVSFVVEQQNENSLIYTYINGIMSGVAKYSAEDNFKQASPIGISIGNNNCTVKLYNIRIYNYNLTSFQVVDNFIADMDNFTRKLEAYERNQVYNEYGSIDYNKLVTQVPCMTIIGELPQYKGNKKTVSMVYEDQQQPDKSFTSDNVEIDVQGTSSQNYPRKNYKTKHRDGFIMANKGYSPAFQLHPDSIPVNVFCEKADFAESSGTHNTGMARMVDNILRNMGLLTPPQKEDGRVRTTIDGYPIVIFHQESAAGPKTFLGKYNFNNDKSTQETFGFSGAAECWEVCNNLSERVLFKSVDFDNPDWLNDFEGRYPDENENPTNLKVLCEWIVSTNGNPEKFKRECAEHFNVNFMLFYYVMTELFAMVDQRAKNMMLASWGNEGSGDYKWYPIFYDNDTVLGINNEGKIAFSYNVEYTDPLVWNGGDSVLWNNVALAYQKEIAEMYYLMRSKGYVSYQSCENMFEQEQVGKWNESVYNMDGRFKYIEPLIDNNNASYLQNVQGSRQDHRKWWLFNRFRYIDSKYSAGDFQEDFVHLRLNTPLEWEGVEPDGDFDITMFADQYAQIKYGSYVFSQRAYKDQPVHFTAPLRFTDTETVIYGASRIKSIGELASKYPGSVDIAAGIKLNELIVGSGKKGYSNPWMQELNLGNNNLLRKLDIRNCPNLKHHIDLSGCESIEEVYATGTSITSVILPKAGILSRMELPGTITNLTIMNQPNLPEDGFSIDGVDNLSTLRIENMGGIDIFGLVERCLSAEKPALHRVRLLNVEGRGRDMKTILKLASLAGLDENGNNVDKAVVTGAYHVDTTTDYEFQLIERAFPRLKVYYDNYVEAPVTTFLFNSTAKKILKETEFKVDGYVVERVNDYTFRVATKEDGEVLKYEFVAKNHRLRTGSYKVVGTRTQSYSIIYEALRTIAIKTYTENTSPAGRLIIDGINYEFPENGSVQIRNSAPISVKVISSGYAIKVEDLPEITNDTEHLIYLYQRFNYKFCVRDTYFSKFLPGVTVEFLNLNSEEIFIGETNEYGEVNFQFPAHTDFQYTIRYKQGEIRTNRFRTRNEDWVGSDYVTIKLKDLKPIENGNVQFLVNLRDNTKTNVTLTLFTTGSHTIYWGDGNQNTIVLEKGASSIVISHNYDDFDKLCQLEIDNAELLTKMFELNVGGDGGIGAFWSIGNNKLINNISTRFSNIFNYCYYIGDIFKNDFSRKEFIWNFYSPWGRVRNFHKKMFRNSPEAYNFESAFAYLIYDEKVLDLREELDYNPDIIKRIDNIVYCSTIHRVILPMSINSLGFHSTNATKINEIVSYHETPPISSEKNILAQRTATIYVPDKSVETYKQASGWNEFAHLIKPLSELPEIENN